jgi:hypothetical protein
MSTKHTFRENVLRIIAVIGLIALLVLGAWGIIQLAFFIPTFLSNLAGGTVTTQQKETLSVSIPVAVNADKAFTVAWTHKNFSGAQGYTLSYACADGLSVKAPLPNGSWQAVQCNTPFNYLNATNTTSLVASASGDKPVTAAITVTPTKLSSGAVGASASANTSVTPAKKTVTTVKKASTTKTNYVASGVRTNLYGSPDLIVRMVSNPGVVYAGTQVNLQFVVENVGTNVAPANWMFTANLPYQGGYNYQSPAQQALYPGDKIVFTLGYVSSPNNSTQVCTTQYPNYNCPQSYSYSYDQNTAWSYPYANLPGYTNYPAPTGYAGVQTASVTVDPFNQVLESNEVNNTASVSYQSY